MSAEESHVTSLPPVVPPVIPTVEPPVEPPITPPVEPQIEPEPITDNIFFTLGELLLALLAGLGIHWRAGFWGLAKYHWKAGRKGQAIKMLFTATKRAKEEYYAKKKK